MKAILLRAMTLQQERIDGQPSPRSLYPSQPDQPPKSLGQIAYTARFPKDDFQKSPQESSQSGKMRHNTYSILGTKESPESLPITKNTLGAHICT